MLVKLWYVQLDCLDVLSIPFWSNDFESPPIEIDKVGSRDIENRLFYDSWRDPIE